MTATELKLLRMAASGLIVTATVEESAVRHSLIDRGFIRWEQKTIGNATVGHDVITQRGRDALSWED
jgi:hypothetical protein